MAMLNLMLIPAYEFTDQEWTYDHPESGTATCRFMVGIVKDQDDNVLWRAPVQRQSMLSALHDAATAVSLLAYQRRHQLPLL